MDIWILHWCELEFFFLWLILLVFQLPELFNFKMLECEDLLDKTLLCWSSNSLFGHLGQTMKEFNLDSFCDHHSRFSLKDWCWIQAHYLKSTLNYFNLWPSTKIYLNFPSQNFWRFAVPLSIKFKFCSTKSKNPNSSVEKKSGS